MMAASGGEPIVAGRRVRLVGIVREQLWDWAPVKPSAYGGPKRRYLAQQATLAVQLPNVDHFVTDLPPDYGESMLWSAEASKNQFHMDDPALIKAKLEQLPELGVCSMALRHLHEAAHGILTPVQYWEPACVAGDLQKALEHMNVKWMLEELSKQMHDVSPDPEPSKTRERQQQQEVVAAAEAAVAPAPQPAAIADVAAAAAQLAAAAAQLAAAGQQAAAAQLAAGAAQLAAAAAELAAGTADRPPTKKRRSEEAPEPPLEHKVSE